MLTEGAEQPRPGAQHDDRMIAAARAVSILGHPIAVSAAAMLFLDGRNDPSRIPTLALGAVLSAVLVMGYAWLQVRSGRWAHVDASNRSERTSLHRMLLAGLGFGALAAWHADDPRAIALGLAAAIVAVAMATTRWWKLSLHVGFAVYAAALLARASPVLCAAGLVFAAAIAWSRLALDRHVPRDLVAGAVTGLAAGVTFTALA
ncbi:MAG: phosphatase PAP2 family protein [Polyangiales bacterium]